MPVQAAGWRMDPPVSLPRATGTVPARRATRNAGFIDGVFHGSKKGGFVGGTHGKFVHVRFADDDGTLGFELLNGSRRVGRNEVLQNFGGCRGARSFEAKIVFDGDRDAVEFSEKLSLFPALVAFFGFGEGALCQNGNVGVQPFALFDFAKGFFGEFFRRGFSAFECGFQFLDRFH